LALRFEHGLGDGVLCAPEVVLVLEVLVVRAAGWGGGCDGAAKGGVVT